LCTHQIKYLGLLENIRVRRAGFCYRQTFEKFLFRFYLLSRRTSYAGEYTWQGDHLSGARCILEDSGISRDEWQIGNSKVFLRHPETLWALETLRDRYWHNMALKIQRTWRAYLRYKQECATRIQRTWRFWNEGKIYFQLRQYSQDLFYNRKERQRFSMISIRRFHGDYLEVRSNPTLMEALGGTVYSEDIVFSTKGSVLVHKLLRATKPSPRQFVMTNNALYIVMTIKEKNLAVTKLERRIALGSIASVILSPYGDDYVVVTVPTELFDVVMMVPFKTEFVTYLGWYKQGTLQVLFQTEVEYFKKKNSKTTVKFTKDELFQIEPNYKKGIVATASALPSSTTPTPPIRKPKPATRGRGFKAYRDAEPNASRTPVQFGSPPPSSTTSPTARGGAAPKRGGGAPNPSPAPAAAAAPSRGPGRGAGAPAPKTSNAGSTAPAVRESTAPAPVKNNAPVARENSAKSITPTPAAAAAGDQPRRPPKPGAGGPLKAEVLFDFSGADSDELNMKEGDIVEIVDKSDQAWWEGKLNGHTGLFPANYVKLLEPSKAPIPKKEPGLPPASKPHPLSGSYTVSPAPVARGNPPSRGGSSSNSSAPVARGNPPSRGSPATSPTASPPARGAPAANRGGSSRPSPSNDSPVSPPMARGGPPTRGQPPVGRAMPIQMGPPQMAMAAPSSNNYDAGGDSDGAPVEEQPKPRKLPAGAVSVMGGGNPFGGAMPRGRGGGRGT